MAMQFDYAARDCDVRECERPRLERFRERLSQWHDWLSADEHSIWNQIYGMLWNDQVFRTINECRRLAQEHPSPNVGFNSAVASFIDEGYAAKQLLAIRRLTETNGHGDAITLPRLLADMKVNADLFTRELYVCYDGLPFDPDPARQRSNAAIAAEAEKSGGVVVGGLPTKGPDAYYSALRVHGNFDRLTGVDGTARSRDDKLAPAIFDQVKSKLGACAGFQRVASKYIAHAADAKSRGRIDERERSVTLQRIDKCQQVICRVTAYIYGPLLHIGGSALVPIPQYNHLANLDKAWVDPGNVEAINRYWDQRAETVESWVEDDLGNVLNLPG